ncbi:MAG: extracellular solute-binding protein [Lachnospiraceae bacterium]|nr:extracellular solute-binding protein [Lachnospiraceae bacterium]
MYKKILKQIIAMILMLCLLGTSAPMTTAKAESAAPKEERTSMDDVSADTLVEDTFAAVSQKWEEQGIKVIRGKEYVIDPVKATATGTVVKVGESKNYKQDVLLMKPGDVLEFEVNAEQAGLYAISMDYYCLSEKAVNHTVSLTVNDEYQFSESRELVLTQYYECEAYPFRTDAKGHEITPDTYIRYGWETQLLKGINQRTTDGLLFYLEKGANKITVTMEKSSVMMGEIKIAAPAEIVDYATYKAQFPATESAGLLIPVEAERITFKNTTASRPIGVRDLEAVPYTPNVKLMSVIGGETWNQNGQALYYEIEVEKSGWYYIGLKYKQNDKTNTVVYRTFTIDGELPFKEAAEIPFECNTKWNIKTLGRDEEKYMFYLEEGTHVIGMEADSSMMSAISSVLQEKIDEISSITVEIKKIIGNNTDQYRDWDMLSYLPDLVTDIEGIAEDLEVVLDQLIELNQGETNNTDISNMEISINQLRKLAKDPDEIPNHMSMFSEGSGSVSQMIGNVLDSIKQTPLELDSIYVYQEGAELPKFKASFWKRLIEEFNFFIADLFGKLSAKEDQGITEEITVWVNRASTYVNQMQTMADTMFTPKTGIKVNFSIMKDEGKLILANTTNTQPDVALGLSSYLPYDLALRGALADLRQFDGFNDTAKQFKSGAFLTHTLNDGIYAIPETQDFYVLFYRKDLMDAMKIDIPDTWDDVIRILPQLQRYGMNMYIPLAGSASFKTFSSTLPFILQFGGEVYSEDAMTVAVNNAEGLEAMKFMTNLFTIYGMPTEVADFYQGFRSGSIPIGVATFGTYLKLQSAAAELAGKWEIALMPGVKNEDGVVERWATGAGTTAVIFDKSDKKDEAWQFLEWWTSAETQTEFGTQMQLLYGETYMWNTANMEAFAEMPLDEGDKEIIMEQWEWLHEMVKTPASYMIERELSNVWNAIVFDGENARSALDDAAITMNQEIKRKMESIGMTEYQLPTIEKIESWVNGDE